MPNSYIRTYTFAVGLRGTHPNVKNKHYQIFSGVRVSLEIISEMLCICK